MSDPATLAASNHASVCAPAGYGKTYLIASALLVGPDARHLVLTHTHAGADAIRRRLRQLGVPRGRHHVDTIAGWALQYARAYPKTTQYTKPATSSQEDWRAVYTGVTNLLRTSPNRIAVSATYSAVYVDEYQDCTLPQHDLMCALAEFIPVRVLGDPLQAIFDFDEPTVDWNNHVLTKFPALPPLTEPHRWRSNPKFAAWIQNVRLRLERQGEIDLRTGLPTAVRVEHYRNGLERNRVIQRTVNEKRKDGKVVVITQWPNQCHNLARCTIGVQVMEPVEGEDFSRYATSLSGSKCAARVDNILEFASTCFTGFDQQTKQRLAGGAKGTSRPRTNAYSRQIAALKAVHDNEAFDLIADALDALADMPDVRATRWELFSEIRRAFIVFSEGGHATIHDALFAVRTRTRSIGRAQAPRTIGRTLLVKGLEFEHAVVVEPEKYDARNLYVALTRGTHTLTLITNADRL